MKRSLALISVFGLFLLGIVIGALGMHLYDARRHVFDPGPRMGRHAHHDRIVRMLDLTPAQQQQVERILRESRAEGRTIHEEMLPRVREHMEQTRERIEAVLTPEQRQRFEEMAEHERGRFERFFLGEHRPGRHKPADPASP